MRKRGESTEINMKMGKVEQACQRYNLGRDAMYRTAENAQAVVRIGRSLLINFSKLDAYIDSISGE